MPPLRIKKTPAEHKARNAEAKRRKNYGLAPGQFQVMLDAQNGVCASCGYPETATFRGRPRALHVDHDHTTGQVRGLLCTGCNTALGLLREDPARILGLIRYLEAQS